jgi:tetratricopeptide (TPR) repeat protein
MIHDTHWLDEIDLHHDDAQWLHHHLDLIYREVKAAVFFPPKLQLGVDLLIKIYPFLLTVGDLKPWIDVLYHALGEMLNLKDGERLLRLWGTMGHAHTHVGQAGIASGAFKNKLARAEEQQQLDAMLRAYIGLFKVQMFKQDKDFNDDMVRKAVWLSSQVNAPELQAALFQAIALAYNHRGDVVPTLSFGQMAYVGWHRLGNTYEKARTAFTLAVACHHAGLLDAAKRFLDHASDLYTQTQDARQYGLVAYEQGRLCQSRKAHEEAAAWVKLALQEFESLKPPDYQLHFVAMSYHTLGQIEIDLKQYAAGRKHLKTAIPMWEKLGNDYERAVAYYSLSYLEWQDGKPELSRRYVNTSIDLCSQLPDMPFRKQLEGYIAAQVERLKKYGC